ncbi:DUF1592 domain-containing protein [Myxococcota bacterium]|nr:DUF1592 domain-containing protein [Myxococcota bacterium]
MRLFYALLLLGVGCDGGRAGKDAPSEGRDSEDEAAALPSSPRVYRLTHDQWERATQDLLGLPEPSGLSSGFIGDTLSEGFENNGDALLVSSELFRDYQLAAETLAGMVVNDVALYKAVVPQDPRENVIPDEWRWEVESDTSASYDNGGVDGVGWMLWSDGTLSVPVELTRAGTYTYTARVFSSDCGDGVYADVELAVDGAVVHSFVATADYADTAVEVSLSAGSHTLGVSFTNDCYDEGSGRDRNLTIDWLNLYGPIDGLGDTSAGEAEARAWIIDLVGRAYRRPLSDEEITAWLAVFDQGAELVGSGDAFRDGVQLVLITVLQSPSFLYRIERSTTPDAAGVIPLDDYELASKLSFALWGTMPDAWLFDLAAKGELSDPETLREVARAMLTDARAQPAVADFHAQLLALDQTVNISKDAERFPLFSSSLPGWMREEAERFVDAVIFEDEGGVQELLSADFTVANRTLAQLYGVAGPADDDTWARVALNPAERAGLLTQGWFLAGNADSTTPSPIHRGVFVNKQILCYAIPEPPPNVTPLPASEEGVTNRDRVEAHTGEGTCGEVCHGTLINPPGFAFEGYDAIGAFRTTDNGAPVDASGTFTLGAEQVSWTTGVQFVGLVAAHAQSHRCYATHWLEYLLARPATDADEDRLDPVVTASLGGASIQDLIVELVASESFRARADEVSP